MHITLCPPLCQQIKWDGREKKRKKFWKKCAMFRIPFCLFANRFCTFFSSHNWPHFGIPFDVHKRRKKKRNNNQKIYRKKSTQIEIFIRNRNSVIWKQFTQLFHILNASTHIFIECGLTTVTVDFPTYQYGDRQEQAHYVERCGYIVAHMPIFNCKINSLYYCLAIKWTIAFNKNSTRCKIAFWFFFSLEKWTTFDHSRIQ